MNLDTLKNLDKKYAQVIADELLKRIENDDCLNNKLVETPKTLKGCIEYIKSEAKKQAEDSCAVMLDADVFQLAQHYFLEDSIDFEPKIKTDKLINTKAEDDEKDEEATEEVETIFGTETITKEKPIKKAASKPKKDVKEKLTEQLSLFDL